MAFDLVRYMDVAGIPYATTGANVSRGNVVTHCPFCGAADEGQHMSVSTEGKGWRCFRHPDHRGQSPVRFLAALLGISFEQARGIVGTSVHIPEDFMARITAMLHPESVAIPEKRTLELPKEFRKFKGLNSFIERPYAEYMRGRGYRLNELEKLSKRYGLRYATSGPYRGRIIFPVYLEGELVSWTGRAISSKAAIRYRSHPEKLEVAEEMGLPPALGRISDYLLWHDKLMRGGKALILVEGPFDALIIDWLGKPYGVRASCFFTIAPSEEQIDQLHTIRRKFECAYVLADAGAEYVGMRTTAQLASLGFHKAALPQGVKDAAAWAERSRHPLRDFLIAHADGAG